MFTLSVYNVQLRNIGRAKCIVCPTNPTVGRATALPAHYVPAPLRPGLLRTKLYSAFHPAGVGKWVPAIAGKAKAGTAHSACGWTCGCAGKTVKSLENTCHIWALLRWWLCTWIGAISSVCTFTAIQLNQIQWQMASILNKKLSWCWHTRATRLEVSK